MSSIDPQTMTIDPLLVPVAVSLLLAAAGWPIYLWRAKTERKRLFRAFLVEWREQVSRWPDYFAIRDQPYEVLYKPKVAAFCAEIDKVRADFRNKAEFDKLTTRLAGLNESDWQGQQNKPQRDAMVKAMDDLLKFIK